MIIHVSFWGLFEKEWNIWEDTCQCDEAWQKGLRNVHK